MENAHGPVVLELRGITKRFPGIVANDGVELRPAAGRGARAARRERRRQVDADERRLRPLSAGRGRDRDQRQAGRDRLNPRRDRERRRHGAPALHADPGDDGRREHRARDRAGTGVVLLDYAAAEKRVHEISARFGLAVDPRAKIEDITVGQQQRVEILKALYRGADILVLDEPTAVLTPQEAQELFTILRSLTDQGKSIIFISHKLNEVLEIADRVTVLRRGKKVETLPTEGCDRAAARAPDGRAGGAAPGREGCLHRGRAAARDRGPPRRRRAWARQGQGR